MLVVPKKPVRVGVIGAGWWATSAHIPAIKAHPQAELHAVQCRTLDKAERVARDFGAAHAFDNVADLLALKDIDAVIVSSTPNVHYVQAKAALESGKHVLIEKPMTFTASEAAELCRLAEDRGLELLISCPWHYTEHSIEIRERIRRDELGEIKLISILMTNPVDRIIKGIDTTPTHGMENVYVQPGAGSYSDPKIAGGGQIYAQVSHAAAYLAFLTGHPAVEVFARFDNAGSANDIYNSLHIQMAGGTMVSLASTGATPLSKRNYEVRVFGTKGIAQLELWRGTCELVFFDGGREEWPILEGDNIYPAGEPAKNLIDSILRLTPNRSDGRLGLAAMQIIEAACRSNHEGESIAVNQL
jgi:predicted dehydrogenase